MLVIFTQTPSPPIVRLHWSLLSKQLGVGVLGVVVDDILVVVVGVGLIGVVVVVVVVVVVGMLELVPLVIFVVVVVVVVVLGLQQQ